MDKLEHAQRVLHLFGFPRVAADHGDAEDVGLWGLEQHHHRHLVGAAGAGAVLIDDDHAPGLCVCDNGNKDEEKQGTVR